MIRTDVCVLGAGPGGVATALQLAKLNIPCVLLDKAVFPRDKVCGDAISGKVVFAFNRIDKQIFEDFEVAGNIKMDCWGIKFIYPKETEIEIMFTNGATKEEIDQNKPDIKPEGFISKRIDFDNFLVDYARKEPLIDLKEGVDVANIARIPEGFLLKDKSGQVEIQTKLLIAADGAQSRFARQFGNIQKEDNHYAGGIRAYYKNVKGCTPYNHIELHFVEGFYPGYLWIFPLPDGQANVGVGMRTDKIRQKKINLTKEMLLILKEHPRFKNRFDEAELTGKIKGFGLPFGSKKRKISGAHFMLVGDAGSLVDPFTGEGIGNAAISGRYAAMHAKECIETNDFSEAFLAGYDKLVYDKLWKELLISRRLQQYTAYPWLVNNVAKLVHKNKRFIEILSATFKDVDLRKKLRNPMFYIRLLVNR